MKKNFNLFLFLLLIHNIICISDTNLCANNNGGCSPNATCTNLDSNHVQCICNNGFTGNGMNCSEIIYPSECIIKNIL